MQILFDNWDIRVKQPGPIVQGDNLSEPVTVEGELPASFSSWSLLLRAKGDSNVIPLEVIDGKPGVYLTGDMLPFGKAFYDIQLRGENGNKVKHSNVDHIYVSPSIAGDGTWPEVPTEFSQSEERIRELNAHPPIPDENGEYWEVWDADDHEYVLSEYPLPELEGGSATYDASSEELTLNGIDAASDVDTAEVKKLNGYGLKDEYARNEISDKVEKARQNINGLDYGVVGDGETDDSAAINALLRNGWTTVYLPNKTYKIDSAINLSGRYTRFICDGTIVYDGSDAAIKITNNMNDVIVKQINATNATAVKVDANEHGIYCVNIDVGYISTSAIGIWLNGGETKELHYTYCKAGRIVSSDTCVKTSTDGADIGELSFDVMQLTGAANYGVYISDTQRCQFLRGAIEGLGNSATAVYIKNGDYNTFNNFRMMEQYGSKRLAIEGDCRANDIHFSFCRLSEVDVSGLTNTDGRSFYNRIHGQFAMSEQAQEHIEGYVEVDPTDNSLVFYKPVTDAEKAVWSGKQDAISDLATIRSGAGAGATAVQPADYASNSVGGTIKTGLGTSIGTGINDGKLIANVQTEAAYNSMSDYGFVSKGLLNILLGKKQNTLTAGTGISIVNGVISCTIADGNGVAY